MYQDYANRYCHFIINKLHAFFKCCCCYCLRENTTTPFVYKGGRFRGSGTPFRQQITVLVEQF